MSEKVKSDLLTIANEEKAKRAAELVIANKEKAKREAELVNANKEKAKREAELVIAKKEKAEREAELLIANEEKAKRAAELVIANSEKAKRAAEFVIANSEKAKRSAELIIADLKKAKREDELIIANKKLTYQNEEKAKRATELVIADILKTKREAELVIIKIDKAKRIAKSIIADKELSFQTEEKSKRAAEFVIAEAEKEKRAAELVIANIKKAKRYAELVIANVEKVKRSAELVIANKELVYLKSEKSKREAELVIANVEKAKRKAEFVIANIEKAKRAAELVVTNKELVLATEKAKLTAELIILNKELTHQIEKRKQIELELIKAKEKAEESEYNLNERVKEISGLFSLGLLTEKFENLEDIYNEFVKIVVPNSMQFPDKLYVALEIADKKYVNIENFNLSINNETLSTPIKIFGEHSGTLTVSYTTDLPFIEIHEQNLINAYGERVSKIGENVKTKQDLKTAKEKAEESEIKYKQLFNFMPIGVTVADSSGQIVEGNMVAEKLLGLSEKEQIKRKIDGQEWSIIGKDGKQMQVDEYASVRAIKENCLIENVEMGLVKSPSITTWINVSAIPTEADKNKIIIAYTDISERVEYEKQLIIAKEKAEESNRLKTAFLQNISHEIRTPMNGILGFSELLKKPNLTHEQQQQFLKLIGESGERMLNTINDIVDISKIEAGLINVYMSESDINKQIESLHEFFAPMAERKGLQLSFNYGLPSNEAIIKTDSGKINSILTNLVGNAIKFTDEGSIEFGYEKNGDCLEFFVKDTGIGIPKDRLEAIFERFIQADIEAKRAFQGSGLGLSISKSYIEELGGEIWVESEEGKGTTFYFTIPYNTVSNDKNVIGNAVSEIEEVQIKNLKILIAEDEEASALFISEALQESNFEVIHASTGVEAIEFCKKQSDIDLILMDIRMPEMDGYEATRQIRLFNTDVIIIAQTAYAFAVDIEKAIEAGCNDYISKPIDMTLLHELIKKHFKR